MKLSIFLTTITMGFAGQLSLAATIEKMSDEEVKQALANYNRFQSLPSEKKEALKKDWGKFEKLSPAEKDKFESRFKIYKSLKAERKTWINRRVAAAIGRAKSNTGTPYRGPKRDSHRARSNGKHH